MQKVPQEFFNKANERKPWGFEFHYRPDDADYGIGITTDAVIPQYASYREAARVAEALQMAIFGVGPKICTSDYPSS